jgi:hypothetical protein
MADRSTALPLRDLRSSLQGKRVDIAGLPWGPSAGFNTANELLAASATAAEPKRLSLTPVRIDFVVTVTDNVLLQLWEGTVVRIDKAEFTAILRDKTDDNNPDEEVVLSTEELAPEDIDLLRPGAVFYWSIRYEQEPGLPRRRVSRIRFRRVPGWTTSEIQRAESVGKRVKAIWSSNAQNAPGE